MSLTKDAILYFKYKIVRIEMKPLSVNEAWQGKRYKTEKYKQ